MKNLNIFQLLMDLNQFISLKKMINGHLKEVLKENIQKLLSILFFLNLNQKLIF